MIENYAIFYSYSKARNVLTIRLNDLKINRDEKRGNVFVFYHDDEVVTYIIDGIDKVMKIHAEGLIPMPNKMMIDVINSFLRKEKLDELAYKTHSGFYIGVVKNIKGGAEVTTKAGVHDFGNYFNLCDGDKVILAKKGTFLFDGTYLTHNHLCSYKDLGISDNGALVVDNELDINDDFMVVEEK